MKTTKKIAVFCILLSIGWTGFVIEGMAASPSMVKNTFQLELNSFMNGTGGANGPQGLTSCLYGQGGGTTNQTLEVTCQGLANNHIYHLMASVGTNGALMHLSDFMPDQTGAISMQFLAGFPAGFVGTNNLGQAWGMMDDWNQMSWVIFPGKGTNWCNPMNNPGWTPRQMDAGMNSSMGWNSPGQTSSMMGGQGSGGSGGMGGSGMGGMGWGGNWGSGWPAMTNWMSRTTNWWSAMAGWCWDYTNIWNEAAGYSGSATNWWGNMGSGADHMMPLPDYLNLVPAINGLVVTDENLEPVLAADLANPDAFAFQSLCLFTNRGIVRGATATLQASATQSSSNFKLTASGLAHKTSYYLAINGANVMTLKTDARGGLQLSQLPSGVTDMRNMRGISILNRNNKIVLSATLPPN